ncbi:MAG: response regulator transcription factor [Burkholderiales bacterium]|nr:response regulator transcription factor [Burkholderiales bacterium]
MPITVFIVDDHPVIIEGLTQLINAQEDMRVVGTARNGGDALEAIARLHPEVVVADIAMPHLNGIEATRQILEQSPETHVVILSMHSTPDHIFNALDAGASGYVLKENAATQVLQAVRTVHAGGRYLSERVAEITANLATRPRRTKPLDRLSKREREILPLVAAGRTSAEIAAGLGLSPKTVDTYRSRMMQKLDLHDLPALVRFSIQQGITVLD